MKFEAFNPAAFLPVEVGPLMMEQVKSKLSQNGKTTSVFVEIGSSRADTPQDLVNFIDTLFEGLLDLAIDSECEYIHFYS